MTRQPFDNSMGKNKLKFEFPIFCNFILGYLRQWWCQDTSSWHRLRIQSSFFHNKPFKISAACSCKYYTIIVFFTIMIIIVVNVPIFWKCVTNCIVLLGFLSLLPLYKCDHSEKKGLYICYVCLFYVFYYSPRERVGCGL